MLAWLQGIGGASLTISCGWHWLGDPMITLSMSDSQCSGIPCQLHHHMDGDPHLGDRERGSCFLSQVDSMLAAGWICKSSKLFGPAWTLTLHLELSRELATLLMDHDLCVYSQWFAGEENELTDSLSLTVT